MAPGAPALQPADTNIFNNKTGFGAQLLIDLQRVVACGLVRACANEQQTVGNDLKIMFKTIAACNVQSFPYDTFDAPACSFQATQRQMW